MRRRDSPRTLQSLLFSVFMRWWGLRGCGVIAAITLVASIEACGFGVDLENLFGPPAVANDGGDGGVLDGSPDAETALPSVPVVQIGVGDGFGCARRTDGTVMCWGYGEDGQLGDGNSTPSSKPVLVRDLNDAIDLSVGQSHACAIRANNTAVCWGDNGVRQLGDGTNEDAPFPRPVVQLTDAVEIRAGGRSTCARRKDGTVHCWGRNREGQLGDGTTDGRSQPAPVTGVADAIALGGAYDTNCAVVKSGEVFCWGNNPEGQIGSGAPGTDVLTAAKVPNLDGVASLSNGASSGHICAVLASGAMRCWGWGSPGTLGNGKTESVNVAPVVVAAMNDADGVAAGSSFTCARRKDGHVACWGSNSWRQLALGDDNPIDGTATPLPVDALSGVEQLAAGDDFGCAIHSKGEKISCWGANRWAALGRGTRVDSDVPMKVANVTAASLGVGREHTCALAGDGAISCWGMNNNRQQATNAFQATGAPVKVSVISGATQIMGADAHTCGLFGTDIKCWGYNDRGGLGNGRMRYVEVDPVVFATGPATYVAGGYHFTCALLASHQVACAGFNEGEGRIGRPGGDASNPAVVEVPGTDPDGGAPTSAPLSDVTRLAVGRLHSCAIHGGGKVSCWGSSWDGALGVPGDSRPVPTPVPLPSAAIDITASSGTHTCAVLEDGSVRCWGANYAGQVSGSSGSDIQQRTPNLGGKSARSIVAGDAHTCALFTDDTIGCWGRGRRGQLGNGTRADATQPVAVKDLSDVKAIAANANRTCAIGSDGSVYCWGENDLGQLGDGVVMQTGVPAPVVGY